MNIEHIGIAVHSIVETRAIYERMFPDATFHEWNLDSQGMRVLIIRVENLKIELLESTSSDSPISKFLAKRGEGIHHIAYLTDNIEKEIVHLKEEGFTFLTDTYYTGAENYKVIFTSPKETGHVLTEICQRT